MKKIFIFSKFGVELGIDAVQFRLQIIQKLVN